LSRTAAVKAARGRSIGEELRRFGISTRVARLKPLALVKG